MGRPTEAPQAVPPGPVHDAAVPFWHADLFLVGDGRGAELGRSR